MWLLESLPSNHYCGMVKSLPWLGIVWEEQTAELSYCSSSSSSLWKFLSCFSLLDMLEKVLLQNLQCNMFALGVKMIYKTDKSTPIYSLAPVPRLDEATSMTHLGFSGIIAWSKLDTTLTKLSSTLSQTHYLLIGLRSFQGRILVRDLTKTCHLTCHRPSILQKAK